MIESLKLLNFQSHKNTSITLSPKINIFVGGSNVGKTSLLRAINWITYNRPSGTSMVGNYNRDKKDRIIKPVKVRIKKDNNEVIRVKSDKENYYVVNENKLNAIGLDVPEEVKAILNLNDINFQKQFDSSFLLSWSSAEVTRYLNKLVGLDDVDKLHKRIGKDKREVRILLNEAEKEKSDLVGKLEKVKWVDSAWNELMKCEKANNNVNDKLNELEKINGLIMDMEEYENNLKRYEKILKFQKQLNELENTEKEIIQYKDLFESIFELINVESEYEKKLKELKRFLSLKVEVENLDKIVEEAEKIEKENEELKYKLDEFIIEMKELEDIKDEIESMKKSLPDICPLCGQIWPKEKSK